MTSPAGQMPGSFISPIGCLSEWVNDTYHVNKIKKTAGDQEGIQTGSHL